MRLLAPYLRTVLAFALALDESFPLHFTRQGFAKENSARESVCFCP